MTELHIPSTTEGYKPAEPGTKGLTSQGEWGQTWRSIAACLRHYGNNAVTFKTRCLKGMSPAEAAVIKRGPGRPAKALVVHSNMKHYKPGIPGITRGLSKQFHSHQVWSRLSLCLAHYGTTNVYYSRIRHGWDITMAAITPPGTRRD